MNLLKSLPSFTIKWFIILNLLSCKEKSRIEPEAVLPVDTSLDALNQKIEKNPDNDSLYYLRAKILSEQESFDSAITDLKKAISIDSTKKPVYYHFLSDLYLMNVDSKAALRVMEKALILFPNDIGTLLKSARLKLILKQHMAALATLDKIFMRDPQNSPAYYLAGHVFYEMGDTGRAVNSYQKAVDMDPDLREGWIRLGDILTELHNPKAIAYYDNAIRMDTLDADTWHSKAYALEMLGDRNRAMLLYKEMCLRFPSFEPAFFNLGMLYKKMDSLQQAITHFDISVRINPAEPSSYYQRGMCNLKLGNSTQAKEDFATALRLDPEFEEAKMEMEKIK